MLTNHIKFRNPIRINPLTKMRIQIFLTKPRIKCNFKNAAIMNMGMFLLFSILFTPMAFAASLVSDPQPNTTCYEIRLLNSTPDPADDPIFKFNAQADGSLRADLVNNPAGENKLMVLACNVWGKSVEVPFTFDKTMPGISTNMALVNINGIVYIVTGPQPGIIQYRVIIDGDEYFVDAESDGSLKASLEGLENGIHSIELYAINMWGEGNPAPFGFTKIKPNAPQNLQLTQ
ncbi:hypothetical protein KAR91_08625 [Candidatus Pacearchaeota archaeon]|nr:hypothetical protein [Candidatus Pacearchaeota archaeon]